MLGKEKTSILWLVSTLALTIGHYAEEADDIASSLECDTDYNSKIDCRWTENAVARHYIPMDLYYKKETQTNLRKYTQQKCNLRRSPENTSSTDINWQCTIKETSYAISFNYNYVFKPKRPVKLSKSFRLLENIKPQPPFNLSVTVTAKGDYLLVWQTIYERDSSNMLFGKLLYEINYKRTWESWENSVTENVSEDNREFQISKSLLATSDTYIARVRAKPRDHRSSRGLWSEWSTEIQWDITEHANNLKTAEAEVMPRNLQCTYDGVQEIECTWEVTRESSKYFKFNLHYGKANSTETKECKPSVILRTLSHLTVHRCNIPVQEAQDNYKVFLKLVEPAKTFEPYKNIKTNAPFNLTIKQLPDGRYQLDWLTVNARYHSEYEIYYKKVEDSWENSKVKKIPQDTKSFKLPKNSLDSSSRYSVRVRAKVICQQDAYSYCGPWSEWSQEATLDTDPDNEAFIAVACVMLMVLISSIPPFFYLIKRKKRSWLESIPDPSKSKLFHKESLRGLLGHLTPVETVTLEEGNICQVVADESSDATPQVIPKEKAEFTQIVEEPGISSPLMNRGGVDQQQLYQVFGTATETESPNGEVFPNHPMPLSEPSDYNGPYLYNYQDISAGPNSHSEFKNGFNKNASYFKCDQGAPSYVKLPQNSSESLQALDQESGEQALPLPISAYVLNPPQSTCSSPLIPSATDYHVHTDNTARACLGQSVLEQPSTSTSSYVLCPPLTNTVPVSSPEVNTGYLHSKDADIFCSSLPVPGSDSFATPTASQQSTVSNCRVEPLAECNTPTADDKNTQGSQSCCDVSQENPVVMPWQPAGSGYVLTPPGDQVLHSNIPPKQDTLSKHENQSLSAEGQHSLDSEDLICIMPMDRAPGLPCSSQLQVDTQKSEIKEEALSLKNMQNDAANVILYQQGAKPLLLQQIGDYCFIPGSPPANRNGVTKCHLSPSLTNTEPANKHSVFHEDLKAMPPVQSPYTTSNNVSLS
ncbi:cytokine receptor common subunit beta [Heterodontus francisci]|uniref:cytokine receptor common subunit beta n=1 Tax=Heterodontus francisci TaxID=7792 RepID=UPI00355C98B1